MKNEAASNVLTGGLPPYRARMNKQRLQNMVTRLVQCNSEVDCSKNGEKGLVRRDDIRFRQTISNRVEEMRGKATPMAWNSILKDLIARCPQFCRDELVNIPRPFVDARWRETGDRKVLAPLALKHNAGNIIAGSLDMSRKRKAQVDQIWTSPKRLKLDCNTLKSCSVVIKKTSVRSLRLKSKFANNRAFVKLFDVLKELPQEKQEEKAVTQDEYMGFLGLDNKQPKNQKQVPERKTGYHTKLVSQPHIPFSSDYGRRLLARERHGLTQEVALRKIERTEWYLKGAASVQSNDHGPEDTFDARTKYIHSYKFPKRQFHQHHESLHQAFLKYVCKPFRIVVQQRDLTPFVTKIKAGPQNVVRQPIETPNVEELDLINDDDDVSVAGTILCCTNTEQSSSSWMVASDDNFSDVVSESANEDNFSVLSETVDGNKKELVNIPKREYIKFKTHPKITQLRRSHRLNCLKK